MSDLMQLQGFRELAAALKELGPKVARNTLRRATSTGAARVRDTAKIFAPEDTGEMKRDIQVKRERTEGPHIASYSVYVRGGKKSRLSGRGRNVEKDSWYWWLVEFGTSKMAAQQFMRPAFESEKEAAVEDIGRILDEGIQKAAAELAGRR